MTEAPQGTISDAEVGPQQGQEAPGAAPQHDLFVDAQAKIQRTMDAKVEKVRADESITPAESYQQIAEISREAEGVHHRVREAYERDLKAAEEECENNLFAVDPISRNSVRQSYEMVHAATALGFESGEREGLEFAHKELERLETRARRTGDSALMTAVGQIALERGVEEIRDRYLAANKEKRRAFAKLGEVAALRADWEDKHRNLERTLKGVGVLVRPHELG